MPNSSNPEPTPTLVDLPTSADGPVSRTYLLVEVRGQPPVFRQMTGVLILGRASSADVVLVDARVSRHHAMFSVEEGGEITVTDLDSQNGTRLNEEFVTQAVVAPGDRVRIGRSSLVRVVYADGVIQQIEEVQRRELVGRIAGGVAHEFNNILAIITVNLGVMRLELSEHTPLDAPLRVAIGECMDAAVRGRDITGALLSFANPGAATRALVHVEHLLADYERIGGAILKHSVDLIVAAEPGLRVTADAAQLHQVLLSLTMNAQQAMPTGGELLVKAEAILDAPSKLRGHGGKCVQITMTDTGVGMDAATLESAFESFFTTRADQGAAGLGLSVVHGVVRAHHGAVDATSTPGEGSTFRILLPLAMPEVTDRRDIPVHEATAPASLRILVVDDEASLRRATAHLLRAQGHEVWSAKDGLEGVEVLDARAGEIDVVLLDLHMPRMNGEETFGIVRRRWPKTRMIITSGNTQNEGLDRILQIHPVTVLQKPFDEEALLDALQRSGP